jgi:hypothetical protein
LPTKSRKLGFDAAIRDPPCCPSACVGGINAALNQLPRLQVDVMGEFLVHFLLNRHAPQKRSQSPSNGHR